MYNLTVITPASSVPVAVADLRVHLKLNDTTEDATLADLLSAAVNQFEDECRRPILPTRYRQTLAAWPDRMIVLGRGNASTVHGLWAYTDTAGTAVAVPGSDWFPSLLVYPSRVVLNRKPDIPANADAVGYLEFTAGWPDAASVPAEVKLALKLLAAHWYANPEAYTEKKLDDLPAGWCRCISKFKHMLQGDWGQA